MILNWWRKRIMKKNIIKVYKVSKFINTFSKTRYGIKIDGKSEEVFRCLALLAISLAKQLDTTNKNMLILIGSMIKDIENEGVNQ